MTKQRTKLGILAALGIAVGCSSAPDSTPAPEVRSPALETQDLCGQCLDTCDRAYSNCLQTEVCWLNADGSCSGNCCTGDYNHPCASGSCQAEWWAWCGDALEECYYNECYWVCGP